MDCDNNAICPSDCSISESISRRGEEGGGGNLEAKHFPRELVQWILHERYTRKYIHTRTHIHTRQHILHTRDATTRTRVTRAISCMKKPTGAAKVAFMSLTLQWRVKICTQRERVDYINCNYLRGKYIEAHWAKKNCWSKQILIWANEFFSWPNKCSVDVKQIRPICSVN